MKALNSLNRDSLFDSSTIDRNLLNRSLKGGAFTIVAQGVQFVLRMVGIIVLARLLTPDDFGLIGMVMVVIAFGEMFKDAGLSMATIQKDQISHEQVSSLFWFNVFFSVFLGICIMASSSLVAVFYGRTELKGVTAALAASFLFTGFMVQHQALLKRHLKFGTLAIIQIFSEITRLGVSVILAVIGFGYWSLVGGTISMAFIGAVLSLAMCPWKPGRPRFDAEVRKMLKFGGHLTGFSFANYFARNADNLLIGKFIGAVPLGLYGRAYSLFMMPITQLRTPITNVAMPVLSSIKTQTTRYVKYYTGLLDILATLSIPLTVYCIFEAEFIIRLLLGPQWLAAVPVFRLLAIAGLIQPVASTRGLVLLSHGYSQRFLMWGLINSILTIIAFTSGLPYGISGVAGAYAIMNYIILIPSLYYCFYKTPVTPLLFLKVITAPLIFSFIAVLPGVILRQTWKSNSLYAHLVFLNLFVLLYCLLSFSRKSVRENFKLFSQVVFQGPKTGV